MAKIKCLYAIERTESKGAVITLLGRSNRLELTANQASQLAKLLIRGPASIPRL